MSNKKLFFNVLWQSAVFVMIGILAILILDWTTNIFSSEKKEIKLPKDEYIPLIDQEQPKKEYQIYKIAENFTPSSNPYKNFNNEAFKIALNGEFKEAILEIKGQVLDGGIRFISLAVNNETGILNAVRNSEETLDFEETKKQGGVFYDNIEFEIDLFGDTYLAVSKNEFLKTRKLTKKIVFWDYIIPSPPTTFRFLVAPFNEDGKYGGVLINEINFKCIPKNNSKCVAIVCDPDEKGTECMSESDNFTPDDIEKYENFFK